LGDKRLLIGRRLSRRRSHSYLSRPKTTQTIDRQALDRAGLETAQSIESQALELCYLF